MSLVEQIKNQIPSGTISQLSGLIGAEEGATRSAVVAAVPGLLSALSGLASNSSGAQKIISAFGKSDPTSLAGMLSQSPQAALDQGNNQLGSLFGDSTVSGIVNALAKYAGLSPESARKLLAYLMPIILGSIAGRFSSKPMSPQDLTSMLADEKASIANALPGGLSLDNVPGLAITGPARSQNGSAMKWLAPLAGVVAIALLLFFVLRPGPSLSIPNVNQATSDLTDNFKSLNETLASIEGPDSAEPAVRKLEDIDTKLEKMKPGVEKMPEAGKSKVTELIKSNLGMIDDQYAKVLWHPGVGEKLEPVMDRIIAKMASMGGVPKPQVAKLSGELQTMVSSLNELLHGIKDEESAETALPKLKEMDAKLGATKTAIDKLPESSKATIGAVAGIAVETLKEARLEALAKGGASEKLEPVVKAIMDKLNSLAG